MGTHRVSSSGSSTGMHSRPLRRLRLAGATGVAVALVLVAASCVPPTTSVVMISMRPDGVFFDMPWPNDVRRQPDGSLDLEGLPGVELLPGETPSALRHLLPGLIAQIGGSVDGFGVNTSVAFRAEVGLDTSTFPTPSESTANRSPVLLMDLDHPGERIPVIVDQQLAADRNRPSGFISVLPYPGHRLRESNRYAVAITRGVRPASGQPPRPAPIIAELDDPWSPDTGVEEPEWSALRAQRDEVRAALESTTGWNAGDLMAFTVFTTQDVDGDVQGVAAAVEQAPAPPMQVTAQSACAADPHAGGEPTSTLWGTVELTRWQTGTYPYHDQGGEIVLDGGGVAVPQGSFTAEFSAKVPCGEPPADGWPLVAFVDGTGGGWNTDTSTRPFDHQGWMVAQISPVYGVDRDVTPSPLMVQLGITSPSAVAQATFYNFFNADAARSNPIQQTGEHLQLLRAASALQLDGTTVGAAGTVAADPGTLAVAGQSQGAQTLPLVASVRPDLAAVVSSASNGGFFHTIAHNTGNREMLGLMTGDAAALDELNPIVQVAQTMLEGSDGRNFPSSVDYLSWGGIGDLCVPFENSRHFAGATGLPISYLTSPVVSLYGDPAVDPPTTSLPVQGNVDGRTRVHLELPGGHYVAYGNKHITAGFLDQVAAGEVPTVPATGYSTSGYYTDLNCPGPRWDVPPTRFAR